MIAQHWSASPVSAQASVPDRHEGTLTMTYQNYDVVGHFDVQGNENENGGTRSQVLVADLDYGLGDRVGLLVSIPFIASKYTGPPSYMVGPFLTYPGPLDDGTYHAAFQDLRIELRRQWWAGPVAVAPFIGGSFPTHDYETVGEAVPGRHRWDLQAGASAGVDLDRILPGSYVHVRYAFGRMQEVDDFPFTRSNIDLDVGVAATSRVLVRGHRRLPDQTHRTDACPAGARLGEPRSLHRAELCEPGGGPSISLTRSTDLFALLVAAVAGSNGAHRQRTIAAGVSIALHSGLHGLRRSERVQTPGDPRFKPHHGAVSVAPGGSGMRNVITTEPRRIWSPFASRCGVVTRRPAMYVPFLLPRSSSVASPCRTKICA